MESRFALVGRASVRIWHPAPPPRRGPDAFPATKAAADASFAEARRRLRPLLCLAAFALALWPHWRWAAARLGDGSRRSARPGRAGGCSASPSPASRRACVPSRRRGGSRSRCCSPRSPPCSACSRRRCWRPCSRRWPSPRPSRPSFPRHAGAAARRPGDAGAAGGLVAAVLRRLSAARGHRRGEPVAARPRRLRRLARRQRDARRRPPGDRRRAVLGRADGLDGLVLRLRRRLLARPAGPGLRPAAGLRRRASSSPATSSAMPCSSASRRAAAPRRPGSTRRSAWSCSASSAPRSRPWWRARASPRRGRRSSFGRRASSCRGRCSRRWRRCSPSAP